MPDIQNQRRKRNQKTALVVACMLMVTVLTSMALVIVIWPEDINYERRLGYDLQKPVLTITLPKRLKEISGLTWFGNDELACVQDEDGVIFVIDLHRENPNVRVKFARDGDYEGIATVNKDFYVARSDGKLFKVSNFELENQKTITFETPLSRHHDVEGLCSDLHRHRLLILCKGQSGLRSARSGTKSVFAFDLAEESFDPDFEIIISVEEIERVLRRHGSGRLEAPFKPSGIAIHPLTDQIYIISSTAKVLIVLDSKYDVLEVERLSRGLFEQPEGITFSPQGDLFISNEGGRGNSNIHRFSYLGPKTNVNGSLASPPKKD